MLLSRLLRHFYMFVTRTCYRKIWEKWLIIINVVRHEEVDKYARFWHLQISSPHLWRFIWGVKMSKQYQIYVFKYVPGNSRVESILVQFLLNLLRNVVRTLSLKEDRGSWCFAKCRPVPNPFSHLQWWKKVYEHLQF